MAETPDDLVAQLTERIGGSVRASAVFGKPVERGPVTVIPVAKARWAFGGGSGTDGTQGGGGGGGGAIVQPVGFIEVRKTGVVYKPIRDWPRIGITVGASLAAAGLVAARFLRKR